MCIKVKKIMQAAVAQGVRAEVFTVVRMMFF
jgi:hypothetical protein